MVYRLVVISLTTNARWTLELTKTKCRLSRLLGPEPTDAQGCNRGENAVYVDGARRKGPLNELRLLAASATLQRRRFFALEEVGLELRYPLPLATAPFHLCTVVQLRGSKILSLD